jgi:glycosyltransferase involved in cell wall biosynthesis
MNICIITSSFPSHPQDYVQAPFLLHFIEGLKKRGHRNFVFTQDREGLREDFLEGVVIKRFPWLKSKKALVQLNVFSPVDSLRLASLFYNGTKHLLPFIRENKIDASLALWVFPGGYFGNYARRQAGIPYSVWALGSDIYRYGNNPFLYPMMKKIIHQARGVFADGFDLSKKVEERFGRKCAFLATTRTLPEEAPDKPVKPGKYRFLFVGRLEKVKGIDLLLHSSVQLKEEGEDFHLTVVGGGGLEGWAKEFVKKEKLEDKVALVGNVTDQTLTSLYRSSDCIVIPSRSESIPLVFSEALAFGKELIVTDVGDMGMLGRQYGVATVIPAEDPTALKEGMKRIIVTRDEARADGDRREELRRLFNIEASVDRFLADYL